jgi:hypothetical protein
MRVERKHQIALGKVPHLRSCLHHAADAGIAVLNRKAKAALERGQVQRKVGGQLTAVDQHLGTMTDAGDQGVDANIVGADLWNRLLA